jgi:hypothetical protein
VRTDKKTRERNRKYHYSNKEKINKRQRKYYQDNKERTAEQYCQQQARYRVNNKEKIAKRHRQHRIVLVGRAMSGYGSECLFCEENDRDVLVFHHVYENGKKHRGKMNDRKFYRWIIENDFPDEIILLCANCHMKLHKQMRDSNVN